MYICLKLVPEIVPQSVPLFQDVGCHGKNDGIVCLCPELFFYSFIKLIIYLFSTLSDREASTEEEVKKLKRQMKLVVDQKVGTIKV